MNEHSKMHVYIDWAKERLDEIDATLASFEAGIAHRNADVRKKADNALREIRNARDAFRQKMIDEKDTTEAAWAKVKTSLEADWRTFEAGIETYLQAVGQEVEQHEAAFKARADAQQKAWHDATSNFDKIVTKVASARKAEFETALKKMKSDAAAASANLERLRGARDTSWSALKAALAESRAAFDRADHAVHAAFRRAA